MKIIKQNCIKKVECVVINQNRFDKLEKHVPGSNLFLSYESVLFIVLLYFVVHGPWKSGSQKYFSPHHLQNGIFNMPHSRKLVCCLYQGENHWK